MPDRCFVAAELPAHTVRVLARARSIVSETSPAWAGEKWVAPELLHVTLAFFGAVPDSGLERLLAGLRDVARLHPPLRLRLADARAVPAPGRASMLWATFAEGDHDLAPLRDKMLAVAGAAVDPRPFAAHVTLVRARRPRRIARGTLASLGEVLSQSGKGPDGLVSVRALTVFASTLGPTGPTYTRLASVPLAGE